MNRALMLVLVSFAALLAPRSGHAVRLFRPLLADPRENQFRMKWVRTTEDWRFGTDISDSTSRGGHQRRSGTTWDVGFGETFRADPWEHVGPIKWWRRYQMGIPAGVFANFDRSGAELVNADYQFGLSMDLLLSGSFNDTIGVTSFDRPVWTLRLSGFHRSTHLGDEYLAEGAFGRNQRGVPDEGQIFPHPPVKRYNLSFESARVLLSAECAPGWLARGQSTVRGYAGFEKKLKIATLHPANFRSAIYQAGFEYRSQGNADAPHEGFFTWLQTRVYPMGHGVDTEYMMALDFKLAKPYEFALADAVGGEAAEVWTPHLWSDGSSGREFRRYAGSWHLIVGVATYQRSQRRAIGIHRFDGGRVTQEAILGLDVYSGYSPSGQFLEQRLRYGPTWVPSLTIHF
jgi:hypothetical protein